MAMRDRKEKISMAYIKIGPRKQTDQGGILTMPLRQNVSWPTDKTWQLTTCPSCGRECWDRPLPEGFPEDFFPESFVPCVH